MPKNEQYSDDEEEVEAVTVYLDIDDQHCIGSKLLTNFYRTIPKFKLNSNIILNNNIELSNELIYHTKSMNPPQLLYRGSRDGFNSKDFHSRCDNQGPTLTIIKSEADHNQIFGGFTTQSWKSSKSEYVSDDFSFIFKIDVENSSTNQQQLFRKFNVKQDKKRYAIFSSPNCLPVFGGGCDFCICSDCNLRNYSYSNFGFSYELPPPPTNNNGEYYQYKSEKAKRYLAGSSKFMVSEIEVFKITTITTTTTTTAIQ